MRKITIILFFTVLVAFSCNEDELINISDPSNVVFEDAIKTADDLQLLVNGAYELWRQSLIYDRWANPLMTLDARTDDAYITASGVGFRNMGPLTTYINDASDNLTKDIWYTHYIVIRRVNEVLRFAETMEDPSLTDDLKKQFMGQVLFLRGFCYYKLVLFYGENIPLITENPTTFAGLQVSPAEDGEVWAQVEADLKEAESLLPPSWSGDDKGRATKGAAVGILGKAYLQQMRYGDALTQFDKIINGQVGEYSLVENFRDNHTEENEFNEESIFELHMAPIGSQAGEWFAYSQSAGIGRWHNIRANQGLLDVFQNDNAGDPRYHMTFYAPEGAYRINGQDTIYFEVDNSRSAGIITIRKWDNEVANNSMSRDGVNYRILRYADVLLSAAECALETGDEAKAKNYISQVRQRANNIVDEQSQLFYSQDYTGDMPDGFPIETDIDAWMADKGWNMKQVIINERRMELSFEQSRYWDLIRWDAAGWLDITNYITATAFTRDKLLFPIPEAELSANEEMVGNSAN